MGERFSVLRCCLYNLFLWQISWGQQNSAVGNYLLRDTFPNSYTIPTLSQLFDYSTEWHWNLLLFLFCLSYMEIFSSLFALYRFHFCQWAKRSHKSVWGNSHCWRLTFSKRVTILRVNVWVKVHALPLSGACPRQQHYSFLSTNRITSSMENDPSISTFSEKPHFLKKEQPCWIRSADNAPNLHPANGVPVIQPRTKCMVYKAFADLNLVCQVKNTQMHA